MKHHGRPLAVIGALWGIGLVAAGCGGHAASDSGGDEPQVTVPVRAVAARIVQMPDDVTAPGAWRSSGDVTLSASFPAVVERLTPQVGDRVRAGEVIGWFITRESAAALRGARLMVAAARDPAARADAAEALRIATRDLVRVPLTAPRSGVIAKRAAEPGVELPDGAEVVTLTPDGACVFEARIPSALASRVHAGQTGEITRDPGETPWSARLARVLPSVDSSDQTTLAWLVPLNPTSGPPLGRFATATIHVGPRRSALAVPESAVEEDDVTGEHRVALVGAGGVAQWETVTLGLRDNGWREVLGASIRAGSLVIVAGQHGLADSTRVTVRVAAS